MAKKKKNKIKKESFADFTKSADTNFSRKTQGNCNKKIYVDEPEEDIEKTDIMKMIDAYKNALEKLESKEKKCQKKKREKKE